MSDTGPFTRATVKFKRGRKLTAETVTLFIFSERDWLNSVISCSGFCSFACLYQQWASAPTAIKKGITFWIWFFSKAWELMGSLFSLTATTPFELLSTRCWNIVVGICSHSRVFVRSGRDVGWWGLAHSFIASQMCLVGFMQANHVVHARFSK